MSEYCPIRLAEYLEEHAEESYEKGDLVAQELCYQSAKLLSHQQAVIAVMKEGLERIYGKKSIEDFIDDDNINLTDTIRIAEQTLAQVEEMEK